MEDKYSAMKNDQFLVADKINGFQYFYKNVKSDLYDNKHIDLNPWHSPIIKMYLNYLLTQSLGIEKYRIFASASGLSINEENVFCLDLAAYDSTVLTSDKISEKYADVPPLLVVEVDIKVELGNEAELDFVHKKTQSLLNYGTGKVIWVLTNEAKIVLAEKYKDWEILDIFDDF